MWTNGSGTNSVKPPVSICSARMRSRCRAQCSYRSTWPYMIVAVVLKPTPWAVRITSSHASVSILSGQMHRANLVVQDLGRGARQRAEAGAPSASSGTRRAGRRALPRPAMHLERRERVHVHAGNCLALTARTDVEIGLAGVTRVDPTLHAHFGRAAIPGLARTPRDLVAVDSVYGRPRRFSLSLPFENAQN